MEANAGRPLLLTSTLHRPHQVAEAAIVIYQHKVSERLDFGRLGRVDRGPGTLLTDKTSNTLL